METNYRRLCMHLGATMLFHHFLINTVTVGILSVLELLSISGMMEERAYGVLYELVYAVLYLLSFMLPVAFYHLLARGEKPVSMGMAPTMPWRSVPMILAVLGVNLPCAYLNSYFMDLLESIGIPNILNMMTTEYVYPEEYVLLHMSLSLVPAFCEEFLFRGLICARLRPYGKTVAIFGSAVLFGLMHGNLGQLFYTTMAGIMLGWCYVETGSIWPGVIAHMLNNLTGFVTEYWYNALPIDRAWLYDTVFCAAIILVGMLCLIWLFCAKRRDDDTPLLGLGNTRPLPDAPASVLPMAACVRGFFRPTMVVYFVFALGGILGYLGLGFLMDIMMVG